MRGEAKLVSDAKLMRSIRTSYAKRFHLGLALRAVMTQSRLFVFRPIWIRYLDNTKRLGYKFAVTVPPEG